MSAERWRPIPGHEGAYEVSDLGRVRSLDRKVWFGASKRAAAHWQLVRGRLLRPGLGSHGYLTVVLGREHGSHLVHRLVLLAFEGPCPAQQEVCHGNGDRTDNRLCNLRYGTRTENILDAVAHGTWMSQKRKASMAALRKKDGAH